MGAASLALSSAVLLLACDSATGPIPVDDPAIRTDRSAYALQPAESGWRTSIPYEFTNITDGPVTVAHCGPVFSLKLQQWRAGEWVDAWYPLLPLCLGIPLVLEPGETQPDTVRLFIGYPGTDAYPTLEVDRVEGVYRIVWTGVRAGDAGSPGGELPVRLRSSNPFELVEGG